MLFVERVLYQLLAAAFSLLRGMYKKHFDELIAQSHEGGDFSFPAPDDVKFYGLEVSVSYQWFIELYVLFRQEMVGASYGGFPYGEQLVIVLRGGAKNSHSDMYCCLFLNI